DDVSGDDGIDCACAAGLLRLTHAVANDFAASELHLLAIDREVLLHLDNKVGVGKAHLVADRGAEHLRICGATHRVRHDRESHRSRILVMMTRGNGPITAWLKPQTRRSPL